MAMRDDLDIPMPSMSPGGASTTNFRVARQPEGLDANTKRMAIVAAAIVGVFVVFAGVYSFMGQRRAGVPVIEADSRPLREKPKDAGGMQVIGKDETIMSGGGEAKTAISAPSEAPAPQALRAAVTPVVEAPVAGPQAVVAPTVSPPAAPQAAQALMAPMVTPSRPVAAPASAPKLVQAEVKPAVKAPVAQSPVSSPVSSSVSLPVPAAVAPGVVAAPRAAAAGPVAGAPAKGVQVQLGAVASEQAAHAEWQRLAKRMPDLFGGKAPAISKVERDGKTLWRVRTGGFADANAAKAFCAQVKAKASGCIVSAS